MFLGFRKDLRERFGIGFHFSTGRILIWFLALASKYAAWAAIARSISPGGVWFDFFTHPCEQMTRQPTSQNQLKRNFLVLNSKILFPQDLHFWSFFGGPLCTTWFNKLISLAASPGITAACSAINSSAKTKGPFSRHKS